MVHDCHNQRMHPGGMCLTAGVVAVECQRGGRLGQARQELPLALDRAVAGAGGCAHVGLQHLVRAVGVQAKQQAAQLLGANQAVVVDVIGPERCRFRSGSRLR